MIFEIITTAVFGSIAVQSYLKKNEGVNDSQKINKIFTLSGLNIKHNGETFTAQLVKKNVKPWGMEYKYRIPLGRSFKDYESKKNILEDGLNNRKQKLTLEDLKGLKFDRNLLQSIKTLGSLKNAQESEIELSYDGLLNIRVYNQPLPSLIEFKPAQDWKVFLGVTREDNKDIFLDFEKVPHLAMGGATTYGKSNFINCLITSLLTQQPENTHLYLIDLKGGVELCDYENIKQTVSIAYEPEEALETLELAYENMRKLQSKLRSKHKKNVREAGIKERHFIIIDEVGELNPGESVDKDDKKIKLQCQRLMSQIARLGASLGFRQVLATQYPTGDIIPRQCKQNSDAKVCFRVQSDMASRVVLDSSGAEHLPEIKGRAIFQTADKRITVQTPLINSEVIAQATTPYIREIEVYNNEPAPKREEREHTVKFEKTRLS